MEDEQSIASISVFDNEIIGIVSSTDLGNVVVGRSDINGEHVIYQEKHLLIENSASCETLEVPGVTRQKKFHLEDHQRSAAECVQIYFETSFSLFQNKGSFCCGTKLRNRALQ